MRLPIQAHAFIASQVNDHWEFLLLRRTPAIGGFWQGVSGAPESLDESLSDTALREMWEETGMRPIALEDTEWSCSYLLSDETIRQRYGFADDVREVLEHVFLAIIERQTPTLSCEHDEWRWCTFDEALNLLPFENYKQGLRACLALLESRHSGS